RENVVAEAGARARIRREQPAQHAKRRGLAAAVRPEEAVDLAPRHFEGEIVHHHLAVEAFGEARDVDGDLLAVHRRTICWPGASLTVTGWPAVSEPASPSGRASTRNTSFSRCSREKITGGVNSASRAMKLILALSPGGQPSQVTFTVWSVSSLA